MKFQYADGSPTITHLKSGVEFVVSYGNGGAPLKAIANPTTTAGVNEREIAKLSKEAFTHVQNVCNRAELKRLADRYFSHDLLDMLPAFTSGDYDKEVSTRTLQSWTAPIERTSSRTCPAWALDAVRKYIESNKEAVEHYAKRGFEPDDRGYGWRKDNRLLEDAHALAVADRALRDRITNCPASLLPQRLADEIIELRREIQSLMIASSTLHSVLDSLPDDATIGDLKAKLRRSMIEQGVYSVAVKKAADQDSDLD
jgi:hypothetical protein